MEGRGGISSAASLSTMVAAHTSKRRRPTTGTKRKVIQSIVGSAIRQGKKIAALRGEAGFQDTMPPLPAVAPILANFIIPTQQGSPSDGGNIGDSDPSLPGNTPGDGPTLASAQGIISGASLEDSMYVHVVFDVALSACVAAAARLTIFSIVFREKFSVSDPGTSAVCRNAGRRHCSTSRSISHHATVVRHRRERHASRIGRRWRGSVSHQRC